MDILRTSCKFANLWLVNLDSVMIFVQQAIIELMFTQTMSAYGVKSPKWVKTLKSDIKYSAEN